MFQFTRLAAPHLCIQYGLVQESRDQCLFVNSPKLFADFHAFHRLLMPRHPPYALSSLTTNIQPSHDRGRYPSPGSKSFSSTNQPSPLKEPSICFNYDPVLRYRFNLNLLTNNWSKTNCLTLLKSGYNLTMTCEHNLYIAVSYPNLQFAVAHRDHQRSSLRCHLYLH